jgi:hypothetical protein
VTAANDGSQKGDPVIPDVLPLLPIRDLVVFPYMIVPLRVTRPVSMEAVAKALESDDRLCFLVAQRDPSADDPTPQQFYRAGTIGMIMRMRKLSEGGLKVLVHALQSQDQFLAGFILMFAAVLTLVGWCLLIKGLIRFCTPKLALRMMARLWMAGMESADSLAGNAIVCAGVGLGSHTNDPLR